MQRIAALPALVLLLLSSSNAVAFSIEQRAVHYTDERYQCELVVVLAAPRERVEAVLRDYARYPELDSRILQARVLGRPAEHIVLLETTLRVCFGPFCRNVRRIEHVTESPGALTAIGDAARSDLEFSETRTELESLDKGATRVTYRASIVPRFWIPSIARQRWMLITLQDAGRDLFLNVEARAQAHVNP